MSELLFRPIEESDFPSVGEIMNKSFGLHRYVTDAKTLECFKMQYIHSCLSEATYTQVAEKDGKVIGIIMGNSKNDFRVMPHIPHVFATIHYGLKMKYYGRKCRTGIRDYNSLHKIYYEFSKKHRNEFDGVLTLFAVDESSRGNGVGKSLLNNLSQYFQQQNTKRIYLYTDITCNFGFYEHFGFKRLEEKPLMLTRDGKPFLMNVFLYGLDTQKRPE